MLSLCILVLVVTYVAVVPPSTTGPKISPISILGLPNTVLLSSKEERRIDSWSHTKALSPAKKPGFHTPPSGKTESHMATGQTSGKPKFYLTAAIHSEPSSQPGSDPQMARPHSIQASNKVILIWTRWFGRGGTWSELPEGILNCAQYNFNVSCRITYNKEEYEHSDLVAFHGRGRDFALDNLPNLSKRSPHQRWVYYNREPPPKSGLLNKATLGKRLNGLFNWTMTYMLDSDIDYRYYRIVPGEFPDKHITKTGEIAVAVISSCRQPRLKYISELQKYIPVHVYGKCGTYKCPSGGGLL